MVWSEEDVTPPFSTILVSEEHLVQGFCLWNCSDGGTVPKREKLCVPSDLKPSSSACMSV
jgi:hypothetical protein